MTTFGYLVFLVRASVPNRSRALYQLDACGAVRGDLLEEVAQLVTTMGNAYHSLPAEAEGFRIKEVDRQSRALGLRINKGPEGGRGETYNTETEESIETGEATALLSGLRAKFYVPQGSYYGLLFVERVGGRHLRPLIYDRILLPVALSLRATVRVEAFAEAGDWERELADQRVLRVSEILTSPDGATDASTPEDTVVRIVTTGTALRRASDNLKSLILKRVQRRSDKLKTLSEIAPLENKRMVLDAEKSIREGKDVYRKARRSSFTVQDEDEYKRLKGRLDELEGIDSIDDAVRKELEKSSPVDRSGLTTSRFDVALGVDRPERNFIVESDTMPQFVYETSKRLMDAQLTDLWDTHARNILINLGVTLVDGWLDSAADTAELTSQRS